MRTPCPCLCGRRLPLSPTQLRDIAIVNRWRSTLDFAIAYNVPDAVVRHVRAIDRALIDRVA